MGVRMVWEEIIKFGENNKKQPAFYLSIKNSSQIKPKNAPKHLTNSFLPFLFFLLFLYFRLWIWFFWLLLLLLLPLDLASAAPRRTIHVMHLVLLGLFFALAHHF